MSMQESGDKTTFSWFFLSVTTLILAFLFLGQGRSVTDPDFMTWMALLLSGLSSFFLLLGRSRATVPAEGSDAVDALPAAVSFAALRISGLPVVERSWRPIAILAAGGLIVFSLWRLPQLGAQESHLWVFLAWLAAILLFLAAVSEPAAQGERDWRHWLHDHRLELLLVFSIFLLGFFLRVWQVGSLPATLSGDEASQGLEALRVLAADLRNPFTTGWLGVPTMSFFYNSVSIGFLGQTVFALRLPWVLIGSLTILTTYLLVRQLYDWRLGLAAAALLATYHYHIHFSRLGSNQIADPFFLSLSLFFLYFGLDRRSRLAWALSGVVAGLAFYFYAGARLTPLVIVAVLAYLFLLNPRRFWAGHAREMATMGTAFLLTAAPMLQYALRFPDDFNARMNSVGIIQSGWLENEVLVRGQPAVSILLDQLQRAALAFNFYADRTVWYGLREPLLDPLFGIVFLVGLFYGTLRLLDKREGSRVAPMVAWWWLGMILGGMLTESPPSSQRLITLAVPVCFFIALALWELVQLAAQVFGRIPTAAVMSIAVLAFAVISLKTYFLDYTPQQLYGGTNAELATQAAPALNALKEENDFYFVGPPFMYWGFATLPYLVPDATSQDVQDPLLDPTAEQYLKEDRGAVFIVVPARQQEVALLEMAFPQGEAQEILSPAEGRYLGTLFTVPAAE